MGLCSECLELQEECVCEQIREQALQEAQTFQGFNPNVEGKKPPPRPEWASYVPGRRRANGNAWKMHNRRGDAVNAINFMNRPGAVYRWENDHWILHAKRDADAT